MSQNRKHTSKEHPYTAAQRQTFEEKRSTSSEKARASSPWTPKRVIAWIAILLLVGMYVATFIAAIADSSAAHQLFRFCLGLTIAVPIFAWILIYAIGWFSKKHSIASLDILHSNQAARKEMEDALERETRGAADSSDTSENGRSTPDQN